MKTFLIIVSFLYITIVVYGACPDGFWGNSCQIPCNSSTCLDSRCNEINGKCDRCETDYWGEYCEKSCKIEHCSLYMYCDHERGTFCEKCEAGRWGYQCENLCPENCAEGTCKTDSLKCNKGCLAGFWSDDCNITCNSDHCKTCDQDTGDCTECLAGPHGYWGDSCSKSCAIPNCAGPLLCPKVDGPTCFRCKLGKWGMNCDKDCDDACNGECAIFDGDCLVYGRSNDTQSPPPQASKDKDDEKQISRIEVFGIAFGAGAVVVVITVIISLVFYQVHKRRTSIKFQKQDDEVKFNNVQDARGQQTHAVPAPSSHSSVQFTSSRD